MVTAEETRNCLTPGRYFAALLTEKVKALPKGSLKDLYELLSDAEACDDEATYWEIVETIHEILFPEASGSELIMQRPITPTKELKARMRHIGGAIKRIRKKNGMTQAQLAKKSGLPQSHISRLETGQHSPSHKTLGKIAKSLGVDEGVLDPSYD